jgi:hypothetical protein
MLLLLLLQLLLPLLSVFTGHAVTSVLADIITRNLHMDGPPAAAREVCLQQHTGDSKAAWLHA